MNALCGIIKRVICRGTLTISDTARRRTMRCRRCNGLMIREWFLDLQDDTGGLKFEGWRCVNCGEVVDPVVLTHRIEMPTGPYRGRTRDRRTWECLVMA